jgi:hypothetical protein
MAGSVAIGSAFAGAGGDFWLGYDIGGIVGGLGGGGLQAGLSAGSLRAGLTAGGCAVLPETIGGGIGFGVGYYGTGTVQGGVRYANYGMFAGGMTRSVLGRSGPLRDPASGRFVRDPFTPVRHGIQRASRALNPFNYTPSRIKGMVGRELTALRARLRGETIIGRELAVTSGGVDSVADVVTRTRSGAIRIYEAKFGPRAALNDSQTLVRQALLQGGTAQFSGARSQAAFGRHGLPMSIQGAEYIVNHYFRRGYWRWFG